MMNEIGWLYGFGVLVLALGVAARKNDPALGLIIVGVGSLAAAFIWS